MILYKKEVDDYKEKLKKKDDLINSLRKQYLKEIIHLQTA